MVYQYVICSELSEPSKPESTIEAASSAIIGLLRRSTDLLIHDRFSAAMMSYLYTLAISRPGSLGRLDRARARSAFEARTGRHIQFLPSRWATHGDTVVSLLATSKTLNAEVTSSYALSQVVHLSMDTARPHDGTIFSSSELLLRSIRRLSLTVVITPGMMLPGQDVAEMMNGAYQSRATTTTADLRSRPKPMEWALREPMFNRLNEENMPLLNELDITIKATGNAVANPVWLWHYVVSALVPPPNPDATDSAAPAESPVLGVRIEPKVRTRFHFQVEQMPALMPNLLVRHGQDWSFICKEGHEIIPYAGPNDVRKFAEGLVSACDVEGCSGAR